MFSLRETTKIRLCRLAFVAVVLLPTGGVLGWSAAVRSDAYREAHEQAIAARLGLRARLARASSPRPDVMLYEGLELADPDTSEHLATLPFVEVRFDEATLHVKLPYPAAINGARLDALWRFARGPADAGERCADSTSKHAISRSRSSTANRHSST